MANDALQQRKRILFLKYCKICSMANCTNLNVLMHLERITRDHWKLADFWRIQWNIFLRWICQWLKIDWRIKQRWGIPQCNKSWILSICGISIFSSCCLKVRCVIRHWCVISAYCFIIYNRRFQQGCASLLLSF